MNDFLREELDYDQYPDPELAKMMDETKVSHTECVACNPKNFFLVPAFCEQHYAMWMKNQKSFEKHFFNGKTYK